MIIMAMVMIMTKATVTKMTMIMTMTMCNCAWYGWTLVCQLYPTHVHGLLHLSQMRDRNLCHTNSQTKVVYSQPRTGFILGAFTIAVPSKNILEDSQPSWVRSLHGLPSSICVLHFHALHEFCTLSGRHIICIFPRFNWMQQGDHNLLFDPPPFSFYARPAVLRNWGEGKLYGVWRKGSASLHQEEKSSICVCFPGP